jgi:hypothetical protein
MACGILPVVYGFDELLELLRPHVTGGPSSPAPSLPAGFHGRQLSSKPQ